MRCIVGTYLFGIQKQLHIIPSSLGKAYSRIQILLRDHIAAVSNIAIGKFVQSLYDLKSFLILAMGNHINGSGSIFSEEFYVIPSNDTNIYSDIMLVYIWIDRDPIMWLVL